MSCILRVSGPHLDVDALLRVTDIKPYSVWRKGEANYRKKIHSESGAQFIASDADLNEFDRQVTESTDFIERHSRTISALASFPGVDCAMLNFGIELRGDEVAKIDFLPLRFLKAVASTGIEVQLSHYYCSEDEES